MTSKLFSSVLIRASRASAFPFAQRAVANNQVFKGLKTSVVVSDKDKLLWNLGKLNHVAIAVPDLDKASYLYRNVLGANVSNVLDLPEHGVSTVFVNLGNAKLELLHPLGDNSPIEGFLKKKADGGIHHICIEVDDIKAAMKDLKEHNIRSLNTEPKIGAHGKPVVFLHPKDCGGVLVEIEEA
ncbi:methylmalonyl-CoA epimerase, mitochondrial-like [Acropora millepora]|uniref:methylmalonyl-CoA epimerase, mitochondrial-like n=1 Tax=Acropora millepora TaxID=45264 RepID=UPI001CF268F8|nr:methylmalonyl-CoA epimerase, mitochondrial-like [Acropora millepora]